MEIERFYRSVLLSYPASYRAERGEEMLAVLMETAPAGGRPSVGEALSLIRHGLALRLTGRSRPVGSWRRPAAAGVVCLSSLLAVFAMVAASALSGSVVRSGFHGDEVYLDPLWPTYLLWLGTFAFVMCRRGVPAAVLSWAAVGTHLAALLGYWPAGGRLPSDPVTRFEDLAFFVPGLVLALLLLVPGRVRRGLELVPHRMALLAVLAGTVPAVGDGLIGLGISQTWATLAAMVVLLAALLRARVLLRAGLIVAFAFSYFLLIGLADGSGSRLPDGPVALPLTLGVLPLAGLVVLVALVRHLEAYGILRRAALRFLESLIGAVRG
ncbi:hypothetical protein [Actinopolymorpha pittospori]|uniref:Peptidoglycan/LPS O-acetylase OafA/YrhL n=1 Tax=Actinopolymorpha pittospori TaxID=648752 RepID=A0A927MTZ9_9ACTN|nr:hypothetical protein [Actinopolymorpha pittospori]MBE1606609.1 peptidoglycan/LPS O-acetylase OafA/YrhL [Actinopolymorpha pittospori]